MSKFQYRRDQTGRRTYPGTRQCHIDSKSGSSEVVPIENDSKTSLGFSIRVIQQSRAEIERDEWLNK